MPASGRSPDARRGRRRAAAPATPPPASLRRGAASSRSATPWNRNGARGRIHDSPGWAHEHVARRELLELRGSSAPLPTIAAGTRASTHAATTSSAVCAVVYACSAPFTSSRAQEAADHRAELVVVGHVGAADHARERLPLLRGDRRDADVAAVARGLVAGDHHPAERRLGGRPGSAP